MLQNNPKIGDTLDSLFADTTKKSGLNIAKLKLCELLVKNIKGLRDDQRTYLISLFSFGKYTDLKKEDLPINNTTEFENLINIILNYKPTYNQQTKTDYPNFLNRLIHLINPKGSKSILHYPNTVITILSDFINDAPNTNTDNLKNLIANISGRSTFFNLYNLEQKDTTLFSNKIQVLAKFKESLRPDQLNLQLLNEDLDLRTANFKSEQFAMFIITNPFDVFNSKTFIIPEKNNDTVSIKLAKKEMGEDDWQQFSLNDTLLSFVDFRPINQYDTSSIEFSGHVTSQFPKYYIELKSSNSRETISTEIIFIKGLPYFISRVFFSSGILIFIFSIVYSFYLLVLLADYIKNIFLTQHYLTDSHIFAFSTLENCLFYCKINEQSDSQLARVHNSWENMISKSLAEMLLTKQIIKHTEIIVEKPLTSYDIPEYTKIVINKVLIGDLVKQKVEFRVIKDNNMIIYFSRTLFEVENDLILTWK